VAKPPIAANLHQPLDIQVHLTAEIALNRKVAVDVVSQARYLIFRQLLHPGLRSDADSGYRFSAFGRTDSMDVSESHMDWLLIRDVHTCDTSQPTLLRLQL
jgi:hypothetical protein